MWNLTRGQMRVALRPIDVIVVSKWDKDDDDDNNIEEGKDAESVMDSGSAYYQLDLSGAVVHHGGPTTADDDINDDDDVNILVRRNNPFDNVGQLGLERREDGIVWALSVMKVTQIGRLDLQNKIIGVLKWVYTATSSGMSVGCWRWWW